MIAYLGPQGTFSHAAAIKFCPNEEQKAYATIYAAIRAVSTGEADGAIVPIENSNEGSVNMTLDTLVQEDTLFITQEHLLKIRQNLITLPGIRKEQITEIISHPQAIGQCARLLNHEFPNAVISFSDSTAKAAEAVLVSSGEVAMIGSEECAAGHGLSILIPNCGDDPENTTRFIRIEKKQFSGKNEPLKTSVAFTLPNTEGTLYQALSFFARHHVNMIKIESRPEKKHVGEYIFFVDVDGSLQDESLHTAMEALKNYATFFRFFGTYPKKGFG